MSDLEALLPVFYKRLFPYEPYVKWLSYGYVNPKYLENREFSFTLGGGNGDVYIRYLSFCNRDEFEKEVLKKCPKKIDVGAIYNIWPRDRKGRGLFQPLEKELVFDIDMTDYDEVRTCCSGAEVCCKCWKFLGIACKILDAALRQDFGYKHLLWVFSGRRGIHCWVCDASARKLDATMRMAMGEYLQLLQGGAHTAKKVVLNSDVLHHSIRRAVDIIAADFVKICLEEQNVLATEAGCSSFLSLIPDEELKSKVGKEFPKEETSAGKWNAFIKCLESFRPNTDMAKKKCKFLKEEIMLQYCYARLDINVTRGLNHLLKSPFCVHPSTGKICVPFNPKTVDHFDPSAVPTIHSLLDEISEYDVKMKVMMEGGGEGEESSSKVKDYKKTALIKSVAIFENFIRAMEAEWRQEKRIPEDEKMEF